MTTCARAIARNTTNRAWYPKLVMTRPAIRGKPRIAASNSMPAIGSSRGLTGSAETRGRSDDLAVESLVGEDVAVIASISHALAHASAVAASDLGGETVLLPEAPEAGCAYRGQFERQLASAGMVPQEKMEFQSIEAVKQCVAAGMGVSVLPSVAVRMEIEGRKLAVLRWEEPFEVLTRMAWHRQRWHSPALRAFLDAAREVFGSGATDSLAAAE
jgi:DNA-binding transcriptional LysR family regulator